MHSMLKLRAAWAKPSDDQRSGEAIPGDLRRRFEAVMRCDLSAVRLQVDPSMAPIGALAAAEGARIHLSPQAPDLQLPAGVAILGHELAHVVQQRQGRVYAPLDGPIVVDDAALECEADQAGLHCVANFFPGLIADPGYPKALRDGAPSERATGRTPVQFIVSAQESFTDFTMMAYKYLEGRYGVRSRDHCETGLHHLCYGYRRDKVHEKLPLAAPAFCWVMNEILDVTKDNLVRVQSGSPWPFLPSDRSDLTGYYTNCRVAFLAIPPATTWPAVPSKGRTRADVDNGLATGTESLAALNGAYLHTYPTKDEKRPTTWRIALNVRPEGILQAVSDIVPIMETYPCINHMKFDPPRSASKADSVIVYMNADDSFLMARKKILQLAAQLPLQDRVNPMMSEIIDGVGEGSEAAHHGSAKDYYASFSGFRCKVFYTAFEWMDKKMTAHSELNFWDALCWVMPCLGWDRLNPELLHPFDEWTKGTDADKVRAFYLGRGSIV